jgi:hypothetical protein
MPTQVARTELECHRGRLHDLKHHSFDESRTPETRDLTTDLAWMDQWIAAIVPPQLSYASFLWSGSASSPARW